MTKVKERAVELINRMSDEKEGTDYDIQTDKN
jgi:hypothetical protein